MTRSVRSAQLTAGINLDDIVGEVPVDSPPNDALISGLGNSNLTIAGVLEAGIDSAISSGLSSAVHGTDFGDGFSASIVRTITNLALADVQFEIGGLFSDANGNPINGGEAIEFANCTFEKVLDRIEPDNLADSNKTTSKRAHSAFGLWGGNGDLIASDEIQIIFRNQRCTDIIERDSTVPL